MAPIDTPGIMGSINGLLCVRSGSHAQFQMYPLDRGTEPLRIRLRAQRSPMNALDEAFTPKDPCQSDAWKES